MSALSSTRSRRGRSTSALSVSDGAAVDGAWGVKGWTTWRAGGSMSSTELPAADVRSTERSAQLLASEMNDSTDLGLIDGLVAESAAGAPHGSHTVNVLPLPSVDSTETRPASRP